MNTLRYSEKLSGLWAVLCCLSFILLWGCDHRPRLVIEGGTVPTFKVEGRGSIQAISVYGPDVQNPDTGKGGASPMKIYWQITPTEDYDVERLAQSGGVVYGQVPTGFKQVLPENGAPPRALVENGHLTFSLRLKAGSGVGAGFRIHNGRAVIDGS
ncbi:MAG: hypothetical protein ABR501_13095 [Pyrinomonadaceae bacterium]